MGGKEMKYILQYRNTTSPQSTSGATLIGSISKSGLHQKGKVDNYENIRHLLTEGLNRSLAKQMKDLESSRILSFAGEDGTMHCCCIPNEGEQAGEIAPFVIMGGDGESELCVPSAKPESGQGWQG